MSFLRNLKLGNHRGDTIVEVMVVLTILGLAIGISYSTADNSLYDVRQAEEHAQATEYAQSQIETMRTMLAPSFPSNIFQAGPYCISQTSPSVLPWPTATAPNAGCQIGSNPYTIKVNDLSAEFPLDKTIPQDTFQILIMWPNARGQLCTIATAQGCDTVTLSYQLHQTT